MVARPQRSVKRTILAWTTVAAVLALLAGLGLRGSLWAAALVGAVGGIGLVLAMQAILFTVVVLVAQYFNRRRQDSTSPASPSAEARPS